MKGVNWGRILARLTAVLVLTRALDFTYNAVEFYASDKQYGLEAEPAFDFVRIAIAVVLIGMSIALWIFSDRFAPYDSVENGQVTDPNRVTIAIVAAIGTFLFLRYAGNALASGLDQAVTSELSRDLALRANVIYSAMVAVGGILMVVQARRVALWVTR